MATTPNLMSAKTTNGDSTVLHFNPKNRDYRALTLSIWGTWDGATVTIYGSHDGTTYKAVNSGAFTTDWFDNLEYYFPYIKLTVSSAGATTSLSAHIE